MQDASGLLVQLVSVDKRLIEEVRGLLDAAGAALEVFDSPSSLVGSHGAEPRDLACVIMDVGTPWRGNDLRGGMPRPTSIEVPIIFVQGAQEPVSLRSGDRSRADAEIPDGASLAPLLERTFERARSLATARAEVTEAGRCIAELTHREKQVLDHVVEGWSARQIAAHLGISARTVEVHRAHVLQKLGARSISELVRLVTECRMTCGLPGHGSAPAVRGARVRSCSERARAG
jgi:FixJ family two-component response regulator